MYYTMLGAEVKYQNSYDHCPNILVILPFYQKIWHFAFDLTEWYCKCQQIDSDTENLSVSVT